MTEKDHETERAEALDSIGWYGTKKNISTARSQDDEQHVMTEAHTPTPWAETNLDEIAAGEVHIKAGAEGDTAAIAFSQADAAFIVRAVNAHDAMVQALEAIESMADEEIAARFRTSSHKTEEQMAGRSVIYSILVLTRNMARAALSRANGAA